MQAVQDPIIPQLGEWNRQHPGTISLGQGVVYYGPPAAALEAARNYPDNADAHFYGPVEGEPALHTAIAAKLQTDNGIEAGRQPIVVTAGSNMAFLNALFAITDPGDEIILLTPYYFNHEMAIRMLNCTGIPVATDIGYQPDLAAIEAAITPRTRAVVTISPNNPSGAVYPRHTLTAVNELCRRRGLYHISDEAYEYFTYDGARHFSVASLPDAADHTISLFSLSKAYGFAGWRIGYMLVPSRLLEAVKKAQDTNLICPTRIAQQAAVAALAAGRGYCDRRLAALTETRGLILAELGQLGNLCTLPTAAGAFYIFLRLHTDLDALTLVRRLIAEFGVAVVPGNPFGCNNGCYVRISYGALEGTTALKGVRRLSHGLHSMLTKT